MRRPATGAALLLALAGCVDFVDPVGLGLARDTRVELALDLADPGRAACSGPATLAPDSVVLCVQATVAPGLTRLGERRRVLDDTLRVLGVALTPTTGPDSILRYQHRFTLPMATLEEIPLTATLPRVEGVEMPRRDIRWFAVGRVDPDSLVRAAGAGVRLRLDRPGGESVPRPTFQYWNVDVAGDSTAVGYDASGVPRAAYDFPAEVLSALGGTRLQGELRWQRSWSAAAEGLQLDVRFSQRLGWTLITR